MQVLNGSASQLEGVLESRCYKYSISPVKLIRYDHGLRSGNICFYLLFNVLQTYVYRCFSILSYIEHLTKFQIFCVCPQYLMFSADHGFLMFQVRL